MVGKHTENVEKEKRRVLSYGVPLVSIILPVYNGEQYLNECLASIYNQSFQDYELIIINDGSTDRTKEILEAHKHRATILHQENKGVSNAMNKGIELAQGKYICFIAHDDMYHPDKLKTNVFYMASLDVGIVYSDAYHIDGNKVTLHKAPEYDPNVLLIRNYINNNAVMVKKECLDRLKQSDGYYYDETLTSCMDGDMWIRLSRIYVFKHIPIPLSYYRIHSKQMSKKLIHRKDRWKVHLRYNKISLRGILRYHFRTILGYYVMIIWNYLKYGGRQYD